MQHVRRTILLCTALVLSCNETPGFHGVAPDVELSAESLDFEAVYVGWQSEAELTATNTGDGSAHVLNVALESDVFALVGDPSRSLGPRASVTVRVRFTPKAAGEITAELLIDNQPVLLRGTGLAPLPCDDEKPCTTDVFDARTGTCNHTERTGPCDDGNACTQNDTCAGAECVGQAVFCPDPDDCHVGACDAVLGCVGIEIAGLCDDDNPCTRDRCEPGSGCHNDNVADGTTCGRAGCDVVDVCVWGSCIEWQPSDGDPCQDGNHCTTGDACQGGACVGNPVDFPPTPVARTWGYGGPYGAAVLLGNGQLLFMDTLGDDLQLTAVHVEEGALATDARSVLKNRRRRSFLTAVGSGHVALCVEHENALKLVVGKRVGGQAFQETSVTTLYAEPDPSALCALKKGPGTLFYLTYQPDYASDVPSRLVPVDFANPAEPVLLDEVELPLTAYAMNAAPFRRVEYDPYRNRLLVGTNDGLRVYDVTDPTAPVPGDVFSTAPRPHSVLALESVIVFYPEATDTLDSSAPIELRHPDTGVRLATIKVPVHALMLTPPVYTPAGVVITSSGHYGWDGKKAPDGFQFWNVDDPAHPALRFNEDLELTTYYVSYREGLLVLETQQGPMVFEVSAGADPVSITGPGHGPMRKAIIEGGLVTYSRHAAHRVEAALPQLRFATGGRLRYPAGLLSFQPEGAGPYRVVDEPAWNAYYLPGDSLGRWFDVSDPGEPVGLGRVLAPRPYSRHLVAGEGLLTFDNSELVYAALPPTLDATFNFALTPLDSITLLAQGTVVARDFVSDHFTVVSPLELGVYAFDPTLQEITLLATGSGATVQDVGLAGDRLITMQHDGTTHPRSLFVYQVVDDQVVEIDRWRDALPESTSMWNLLYFDGEIAYFADDKAVHVITLEGGLAEHSSMATATRVHDLIPWDGTLVMVEDLQVTLATTACIVD